MRVIAGAFKGRRLAAPTWDGLRPTSDKLRETLFNILAPRVAGARLLDGYAGTGAIGIEALSRGAAHVTFADSDPRALTLIRENLERCGVSDRYAIIRMRFGRCPDEGVEHGRRGGAAGSAADGPYDLVVLDPPYDEPDLAAVVAGAGALVASDGLLVLEHARRREPPASAGPLVRRREVASGDSALAFYGITHG